MTENKRSDRLTRDTIVAAALHLLDEVGLDGLTVRRLAVDLGVQNPALYWHFRNKQELLDGMADAIVQAAGMGPPRKGEQWQDWLTRRARAYRRSLLAHRDGSRVVSSAQRLSPTTLQVFDQELAALVTRGFTPALALRTVNAVTLYTEGFVLREQRIVSPVTATNPLGEAGPLPVLATALKQSGDNSAEDSFEYGLRALIDGGEAALERLGAEGRT